VRVVFVTVFDPASDQLDDGFGIGQRVDPDVIAIERVGEHLGQACESACKTDPLGWVMSE